MESSQNANDLSPTDPNHSAQHRATHKLLIAYDADVATQATGQEDVPLRSDLL